MIYQFYVGNEALNDLKSQVNQVSLYVNHVRNFIKVWLLKIDSNQIDFPTCITSILISNYNQSYGFLGSVSEDQIINLLTQEEVMKALPQLPLLPRY